MDRFPIAEAQEKIREIGKFGEIIILPHCWDRMEEKGYNSQDIYLLLREGEILKDPEFDKKYHEWKYQVEGITTEGDEARLVVSIVTFRSLKCITIHSIGG
jgi:hypothetical protein